MTRSEGSSTVSLAGLYEREREFEALERAVASARERSGRLLMVEGPPGVGKTSLLAAARLLADDRGVLTLAARGIELESGFPFGVCLQLFEPALTRAGADRDRLLSAGASSASPLFTGEEAGVPPDGAVHFLAHGLFWLTCNIADSSGPLLIAVDDAQWCDPGSLVALTYLAERLADLPVTLVLAVRTDEGRLPSTIGRLRACTGVGDLLQPAPLSEHGVERVTREFLPDAEPEFIRACGLASGGNPFLLGELLRSLQADEVAPTAERAAAIEAIVPRTVSSAVLARLAHMPADAVALASAIAILGDAAPMRRAATLAQLEVEAAEAAADALAAAHFLRAGQPLGFTHPLIASAVAEDLPALASARAHRWAAALLAAEGATVEEVAAHLLAAPGDGEEWAIDALAAAAQRSRGRGDPATAAALLARALLEPPPAARVPALMLARAQAATAAGAPDAAELMDGALALVDDPSQRAEARRAAGVLLLAQARFEESAAALEQGLDEVAADDPLSDELVADLLALRFFLPGQWATADPRLGALIERVRSGDLPDRPGVLAPLAATLACNGAGAPIVRPLAESALHSLLDGDDDAHGVLSAFAIAALLYVDELDAAERGLECVFERARRQGSAVAYAIGCHWQSRLEFRRGRLDESVASAEQALELGRAGGWTAAILADALIEQGELGRAESALELVAAADRGGIEHSFRRAAQGRIALARGDPATALSDLTEAGHHLQEEFGFDNAVMLSWREPAAVASLRLGRGAEAARLAQESIERALELGSAAAHGSALVAAGLTAPDEQQIDLLSNAVTALKGSGARLELAKSLVTLGGALRRAGRAVDARDPLREGLQVAERARAKPVADHALQELRASGARPRRLAISGPGSLTPGENRVARLAADGLTNKGIAQRLFVTTKTVETHLRHAFRKLEVTSRDALAAALPDEPDG